MGSGPAHIHTKKASITRWKNDRNIKKYIFIIIICAGTVSMWKLANRLSYVKIYLKNLTTAFIETIMQGSLNNTCTFMYVVNN